MPSPGDYIFNFFSSLTIETCATVMAGETMQARPDL